MIELLHPGFLVLALLAPLAWFVPRRAEDALHAALRATLVVLLALALARPVRIAPEGGERRIVVVDVSESVPVVAREAARREALRSIAADPSRATWIEVGAASPASSLSSSGSPVRGDRWPAGLDRQFVPAGVAGGTALSRALDLAARALPPDARGSVTLFTDGAATDSRSARAIEALVERGVPVHVATIAVPAEDVAVVDLRARGPLVVGQTARLVVDLVGRSADVDLELLGDDAPLGVRTRVRVDGATAVELAFEPPRAGFLTVTAVAHADDDPSPGNESLRRTLAVQDPLRVLYVGQRMQSGAARFAEAVGAGFEFVDGEPMSEEGVGALDRFDVVVLDDRPSEALPESFLGALANAVTDRGLGLFTSGGRSAFGPGGWNETPLAELLPVESLQKEEKRDPSTTLVVIIDTSGSMGGNRVQLAKEVARLAIGRLLPHDKVGIVEFYGAKRWAAPIQPASNAIDIQRALNRLDAGGGTVILPAIEEAFYGLQNVRTRYKHVLILTDGGVESGAFEPLLRRMSGKGMNVSTVLIGPDAHSEFLVSLAQWGKGRFYSVPNRFNLPEILLKQPTSARIPAYRPGTHPVTSRGGRTFLGGVDVGDAPPLAGYVETRKRPGATQVLETTEGGHPILVTWPYGVGTVTALTTEPTGPGTATWRDWSAAGRLLARALAATAGRTARPFEVTATRDDHVVTCTARRVGAGLVRPTLVLLGGTGPEPTFLERADGLFTARFVVDPDQEVRLEVLVEGDEAAPVTRAVVPARADVRPERQVPPAEVIDPIRLADATGGVVRPLAEWGGLVPPAGGGAGALRLRELRPLLVLIGLLLWLGELLWRRRPVPSRSRGIGGTS